MTSDYGAVLVEAGHVVGLDTRDAVLLRHHVNAVYRLPHANAVVRIAPVDRRAQAVTGVAATRWLRDNGFPATAPLDVEQPIEVSGQVLTFWRYYDQTGRRLPPTRELARLLRTLHTLDPPPVSLPPYRPLDSFRTALARYGRRVLRDHEYLFLQRRSDELVREYGRLDSVLGQGLIHGDARLGNLLWDGPGVVLGDWDSVSLGCRELDLVNIYQGARYGRTPADLDEFARGYGWDVREWPGYPTLRDIRDLQTLGAPLRLAVDRSDVADELRHRLSGLQAGDRSQRWRPF
jgi:Ser/Thr protein kinase RdoA (MazF antagonist)